MTIAPKHSGLSPSQLAEDHTLMSEFMRSLIAAGPDSDLTNGTPVVPRLVVQYWNDSDSIPADVQACLNSWAVLESAGFERLLFDDVMAADFIEEHFTQRHVLAFERCQHPAMRADYFRLCFILERGGFYVDADDVYLGQSVDALLQGNELKLQPLCYDIATDSMMDPGVQAKASEPSERVFYVNNNPLVAPAGHSIIRKALERATFSILSSSSNQRDIQSLAGPGNLTATLVEHAAAQLPGAIADFVLFEGWGSIAESKWPLEYRTDQRNWRNWVLGDTSA